MYQSPGCEDKGPQETTIAALKNAQELVGLLKSQGLGALELCQT